MTVGDLIKDLSKLDKTAKVCIDLESKPPGHVLEIDYVITQNVILNPLAPSGFKDLKKLHTTDPAPTRAVVLRAY